MWLIESRFKFVNVKGKVQEDVRLRNQFPMYLKETSNAVRKGWELEFVNNHAPKGFIHGTLKVRVRKMRQGEEREFLKSGKLPERF